MILSGKRSRQGKHSMCSTLIGGCYATLRLPAVAVATQSLRYATELVPMHYVT
jgi:hypothetical protein